MAQMNLFGKLDGICLPQSMFECLDEDFLGLQADTDPDLSLFQTPSFDLLQLIAIQGSDVGHRKRPVGTQMWAMMNVQMIVKLNGLLKGVKLNAKEASIPWDELRSG